MYRMQVYRSLEGQAIARSKDGRRWTMAPGYKLRQAMVRTPEPEEHIFQEKVTSQHAR